MTSGFREHKRIIGAFLHLLKGRPYFSCRPTEAPLHHPSVFSPLPTCDQKITKNSKDARFNQLDHKRTLQAVCLEIPGQDRGIKYHIYFVDFIDNIFSLKMINSSYHSDFETKGYNKHHSSFVHLRTVALKK